MYIRLGRRTREAPSSGAQNDDRGRGAQPALRLHSGQARRTQGKQGKQGKRFVFEERFFVRQEDGGLRMTRERQEQIPRADQEHRPSEWQRRPVARCRPLAYTRARSDIEVAT